jgi:Xaa-Pro aminopeptidase
MSKLTNIFKNKVAVFAAHDALQRNVDAAYPYEQESNFFWLTKIDEPGWQLIVDGFSDKAYLVAPIIPAHQQLFDGALEHDTARVVSGIDTILTDSEATDLLQILAKAHGSVHTLGSHPHAEYFEFSVNPAQARLWKKLEETFETVTDCRLDLAKLRAIKQPEEIAAIRKAVDQTIAVFEHEKKRLPSVRYEYEIEAGLSYGFRNAGTQGHAYDPIVASGANACTLHYGKNQAALPQDGLVLIDAGTKVEGYAADITRTYAIGTPTDRQKAVHAAVEVAHHQIVRLLGPGVSVKEYNNSVDDIMRQALSSLDLLKTEDDYRTYFPHAISHGLGLDVHDALGRPDVFQPGMVLTVEPGIYITEEGIGVRIEDDILITDTGYENLSAGLSTSL